MKVVWIAPDASFPARRGGTLRLQGLLRAVAGRAQVLLVAAARDEECARRARAHCAGLGVEAVVVARGAQARWWSDLGAARIERWSATPALRAAAAEVLARGADVVHVDEPCVLRTVPRGVRIACVAHPKLEVEYAQAFAARAAERRDLPRVRRLEQRCVETGALQLLCSEEDRARFLARHPRARTALVQNGVDVAALGAPASFLERDTTRLLWLGSLDYPPNVQGLVAFLRVAWPALRAERPGLVLEVVGSGPSQALGDLRIEGVRFLGEVDDVRPALGRAGALLVPLVVGGGTRLKLLEAAALGTPVVATRVAAEGLALEDGKHLRLVERVDQLAAAALETLDDRGAARLRADAARELVAERYDWGVAGAALLECWRSTSA